MAALHARKGAVAAAAGVSAAVLLAFPAFAQVGAPPLVQRQTGVVKSVSDSQITLAGPAGQSQTIPLLPSWVVIVSRPLAVEAIKPGSYIGTTNYAKADGTGTSTEVHVSPPGQNGPGLDFVMDARAGTTMTNGVIATVADSPRGRVLTVNYGPGVRRVTVPAGIPVVLNTPGDRSLVAIGRTVRVSNFTPATGGPPRQFMTVGENGAPPPE